MLTTSARGALRAQVEVPREEALAWRAMTAEEVAGHQDAACGVDLRPSDIRGERPGLPHSNSGASARPTLVPTLLGRSAM